jgi:hypothetical protein
MTALDATVTDMEPLRRRALLAGGVALAICLIGALFNRAEFFRSYLIAYVFWLGVPLGCLGIVMIHHLVGGTWGFVIQRPLESALRTLPLMALLFVPVCFGLSDLYVWTQADVVRHDPLLQQKSAYLNVPFFIARAVIYFVIWITVGQRLTQWSAEQDRSADAGANRTFVERLQTLSGPGLVLYGLTVTFSSIDWVMSLEPQWYSSIYGMIFMVADGLLALAFVIGVVYFLSRREPLAAVSAPWVFQDLGNLLLAFVMLWAYTSFSQFLIIWIENLTHEIPWYLHRLAGGWAAVAAALVLLKFALPFLLLLSRWVKQKTATLFGIAVLIAAAQLIEMWWFIAPTFHVDGLSLHWTTVLAPVGIGGLWFGMFIGQLQGRPLLPFRDPRFIAILEEHGLLKNG